MFTVTSFKDSTILLDTVAIKFTGWLDSMSPINQTYVDI